LSQGEYHCHNAKALSQPKEPIKSHYSETGGYTTPAPEYKIPKQPNLKQLTNEQIPTAKVDAILEKPKNGDSWFKKLLEYFFN
jgi:hypothetical protein